MALFGGKKSDNPNKMEPKEKKKKKKGKEDTTPAYENPAFEIFDPGSSFNAQSGFISQQQEQTVVNQAPVVPTQPVQQVELQDVEHALNPQVAPTPDSNQITLEQQMASQAAQQQQQLEQQYMESQAALQQQYMESQQLDASSVAQAAPQDPNAMVNYNNTIPGSDASSVVLPEEASVLKDNNQKVERPVKRFRYTIINALGKKENGTFEAETEDEVRNFLLGQDYQVLEVKERSKSDIDIGGNGKIGSADLSFCLTQLSTYLRAGIPLSDSVRILAKQSSKANLKHHFNQLVYQLLKGESLSEAMTMQGNVFPKLLINMVKTAEMTGDLPSILDDMAEYYTSMDQTKKQMKSAMTYPAVVLTIAIGVLIFMLTYLVPQFTSMFEDQGAELPMLTQMIVGVSNFLKEKWYVVLIIILVIVVIFYLCYTKSQPFKKAVQIILMHTPVVKDVIIYNEMANFSKTFASLLNHSVFITDSMEILSKITSNEVYKGIINKTLENLAKGDSISSAFRGEWAIPIVAYEMIVTGESTGQLGAMMEKVASHFQMLHKNVIDQMKSLVEPIMIVFLAGIVGVILVSIIQPMFSIYSQIK